MIDNLLNYIETNNYPKKVVLCEDGTTVSPNPEYDPRCDSIRGLVAPIDENGMPKQNCFKADSVEKFVNDLDHYAVGNYLYIILATPMAAGASPVCIFYMCSDNKFKHQTILKRWKFIKEQLAKVGIVVIGYSSDGDPRLLTAMTKDAQFLNSTSSIFGPYFNIIIENTPVSFQDFIHLVNKMRHSLLNPNKTMKLGMQLVNVFK